MNEDYRWRLYSQIRDIILLATGIGLLIFEAVFRKDSDTVIVIAALSCIGIFTSVQLSRWLLGRMNGGERR